MNSKRVMYKSYTKKINFVLCFSYTFCITLSNQFGMTILVIKDVLKYLVTNHQIPVICCYGYHTYKDVSAIGVLQNSYVSVQY